METVLVSNKHNKIIEKITFTYILLLTKGKSTNDPESRENQVSTKEETMQTLDQTFPLKVSANYKEESPRAHLTGYQDVRSGSVRPSL